MNRGRTYSTAIRTFLRMDYSIRHLRPPGSFTASSNILFCKAFSAKSTEATTKESDPVIGRAPKELGKETTAEILAFCEGKKWDTNIENTLEKFSSALNHKLVASVVRRMENDSAMHFFKWAGRQEGYVHENHLYRLLFRKLVRTGNFEGALQVLKEMKDNGVTVSPKRLGTLFHYYGLSSTLSEKITPELMKLFELSPHPKLYSALIKAYVQLDDLAQADKVVQQLSNDSAEQQLESFNSVISTYARAGKVDLALKVLEEMDKAGCLPDVQTYNLIIRCYCKSKKLEEGFELYEMMHKKELAVDVGSYNALISLCCQEKRLDEASKVFMSMKEAGCCPDIMSHGRLVTAYMKSGQMEKAQGHVENMMDGCSLNTPDIKRMHIVCLCKLQEVDKAKEVLDMAAENGEKLSCDACNKLLLELCKAGRFDDALDVLGTMKSGVCCPDLSSYTILLKSSCTLFMLDKTKELLDDLKKKGLKPPVELYVTVIQAFSRASRPGDVHEVYGDLLLDTPQFSGKKATAVLDALIKVKELDKGLQFCDYVMRNNVKLQSVQLKSFIRLLNKSGRVTEALELLKSMLDKGCVEGVTNDEVFDGSLKVVEVNAGQR